MCRLVGVDISGDVLKSPPPDLGLPAWRRLICKHGLTMPREPERPPVRKRKRASKSEVGMNAEVEFDRVISDDDRLE